MTSYLVLVRDGPSAAAHLQRSLIKAQGKMFDSINVESGVRQGCPLSPLLFILCLEPLLDRLAEHFPEAITKSYADDIAMVLPDLSKRWLAIINIFSDFAEVSGLRIHPSKTLIIPLGASTPEQIKRSKWFTDSSWNSAPIKLSAKYLGVYVGPGTTSHESYAGPIDKLKQRVGLWRGYQLSLHLKIQVWNVFICPVLSYVEQCRPLPRDDSKQIMDILMSFIGGVHGWVVPEALGLFKNWFGVPVAPRLPFISNLREFVLNSRHLDPRRVWMGGSRLRGLRHFRGCLILPDLECLLERRDLNI